MTPILGYDPDGNWDWGKFWKGARMIATGVVAVVAGALVIASGVALVPMLIVAGVTIAAGTLTTVNGVSELIDAGTGYNFMEDGVFQGNTNAYNLYSGITEATALVGSIICGGWLKANKPRIQAYKNVGSYEFSGTLLKADHMSRPFQGSTLTQQQVIKYGQMVKESGNVYKFFAQGSTINSAGNWKLVVNIGKKAIYHFGIF